MQLGLFFAEVHKINLQKEDHVCTATCFVLKITEWVSITFGGGGGLH
jgi:hypothetical protein